LHRGRALHDPDFVLTRGNRSGDTDCLCEWHGRCYHAERQCHDADRQCHDAERQC